MSSVYYSAIQASAGIATAEMSVRPLHSGIVGLSVRTKLQHHGFLTVGEP